MLPGIVIALALVFFATQNLLSLYQTLPLLIIGYAIRYLPFSIGATHSAFAQINPRYEEAASQPGFVRTGGTAPNHGPVGPGRDPGGFGAGIPKCDERIANNFDSSPHWISHLRHADLERL